jgi:hypothetical protein
MSLMRRALHWLTSKLDPPRVIFDREGGSPYLSRYYVFGAPKASDGLPVFDATGNPRPAITWNDRVGPIALYVHKFWRSDDDGSTHNHPWAWSIAIILAGGYREQRLDSTRKRLISRTFLPGMINIIRQDDYHRVDLLRDDSWSLFIAGPRVDSWGFWDIAQQVHVPWRTFIARKRCIDEDEMRPS